MKMRTLSEAADELGTTRYKLRQGILEGRYPFLTFGSRRLVDVDVLRPMLEAEKVKGKLLRPQECADQIGMSAEALRRMARSGTVPFERRKNRYYFNLGEVQAALKRQMVKERK